MSKHLAWCSTPGECFPDLLPLRMTPATLDHVATQGSRVQDRQRRTILIKNPSRMLAFAEPAGTPFHPFNAVGDARILLIIRPAESDLVNLIDLACRAPFARPDRFSRLLREADDEVPAAAFLAMASIGAMALTMDQNADSDDPGHYSEVKPARPSQIA